MTTEQGQVWTDERINAFAGNAPTAWEARRLGDAMRKVRDDMQARLASLERANAELRAQVTGAWQPLPDNIYGNVAIGNSGELLSIVTWDAGGQNVTDTWLAANVRLCRRVTAPQANDAAGQRA